MNRAILAMEGYKDNVGGGGHGGFESIAEIQNRIQQQGHWPHQQQKGVQSLLAVYAAFMSPNLEVLETVGDKRY
jgi:hypothetical protein